MLKRYKQLTLLLLLQVPFPIVLSLRFSAFIFLSLSFSLFRRKRVCYIYEHVTPCSGQPLITWLTLNCGKISINNLNVKMDGNMDGNIAIWTVTWISHRPITGLPKTRPITEHLNVAITGSGEWSAEILFIFDKNVTLPKTLGFFAHRTCIGFYSIF